MLLRLSRAYDSPGDSVKIQIVIQRPWAGVEEGLRVCISHNLPLTAQLVKNVPAIHKAPVQFPGWEDTLEKGTATHSSIFGLPWWLSW